jgi:hypothetical protein
VGAASQTPNPLLSVIIVSWNTRELTLACAESVLRYTSVPEMEVIVIDNGSTDGTAAALRARCPSVRIIENERNVGAGAGYNQGMAAARGELLLLINSDTYVQDDVIGRGVRRLVADPELGMLGCELRYPDGRHQYSAFRACSIRLSLIERLWLYRLLPRSRRGATLLGPYWEDDREIEVDWLAGAFTLLRGELFRRFGGHDDEFSLYGGEDVEWGIRLRQHGVRILYAPKTGVVYHHGAATAMQVWTDSERVRRNHRLTVAVYARLHGRRRAWAYRGVELLGVAVRWIVYTIAARIRPSEYYASQAATFGMLTRVYLAPR